MPAGSSSSVTAADTPTFRHAVPSRVFDLDTPSLPTRPTFICPRNRAEARPGMGGFRSLSGRCPVVIVGVARLGQGRLVQVRRFGVQGIVAHPDPKAFGGARG